MTSFIQMGSAALGDLVQKVRTGTHNGALSPRIVLRCRKAT